MVLSFQ